MRLRALVLAADVLCPAFGPAQDQFTAFVSGNRLLETCAPVQTPTCYAYVEGVVDALQSTFSALRNATTCPVLSTAGSHFKAACGHSYKLPS